MSRPSTDVYMMAQAVLASGRGTCARRKVGCVLIDRHKHVMSTGYNGVPSRFPHCSEFPCAGATLPSGSGLDACMATHAEQNALLQCKDVNDIQTCYSTTAPCITCIKLLLNTGCQRIVFAESYPHSESKIMWEKAKRVWQPMSVLELIEVQQFLHQQSQLSILVIPTEK